MNYLEKVSKPKSSYVALGFGLADDEVEASTAAAAPPAVPACAARDAL